MLLVRFHLESGARRQGAPNLITLLQHHAEGRGAHEPNDPVLRHRSGNPITARRYDRIFTHARRTGFVDTLVRNATDESLARIVDGPNGTTTTVGDCIRVVMLEEWWHHRYADRDLAVLTNRAGGP